MNACCAWRRRTSNQLHLSNQLARTVIEWMYFSSTSTGSSLDYVVVQYAGATYQLSHDDFAAGSMCGYHDAWNSLFAHSDAAR
ncbi:MAG: hypothetical protein U0641_01190 [Anaerolineae bacterium]